MQLNVIVILNSTVYQITSLVFPENQPRLFFLRHTITIQNQMLILVGVNAENKT